jgi:carotenoid cleavage dioxygenase-like enzyme
MADGTTVSPHLRGPLAPVRSEDDFALRVEGKIPEALFGAYYRNGPNPQFEPRGQYHAFLGDGMIHGFFLDPKTNTARYRNRWVRTPRWQAEHAAGHALFGGFGGRDSDPSVANVNSGGANTNIVWHAGKLMALQEQSEPFAMDPIGLEAGDFMQTGGKFTAHPKIDPETGELVWFAYSAGPMPLSPLMDYGVTDASGKVVRRDRFTAPYASMMHDFIVTQNYVLFPVLPLTMDIQRAMQGKPPIAWEKDKPGYVGVMKRNAGVDTIRWVEIDPNYMFHPLNAWEEGSKIHCELVEYAVAPLFPMADGSPPQNTDGNLTRWTIDMADPSSRAKRQKLDDLSSEFPRPDERFAGLPYRHGWYVANVGASHPLAFNSIVHLDLKTGARKILTFAPGDYVGEPIFVPRSATAPEGDGHLIVLVYRAESDTSDLLVLEAQDINAAPTATIHMPRRVPSGFHGNWAAGVG